MPISLDSTLGFYTRALTVFEQRAEILASNLANADTPGYKARDVDFKAALSQAGQGVLPLKITSPRQIQPVSSAGDAPLLYRVPYQPSLDGNTVETQMDESRFAQNALRYQAALTFLTARIKGLQTAITGS